MVAEAAPLWSLKGMTESSSGFWTVDGTFPEEDVQMPDLYGTGANHHHLVVVRSRKPSVSQPAGAGGAAPTEPVMMDVEEQRKEQQEPARPEHQGSGTIASSAFNLASTALGAGTLGLPFAFAQTGAVLGCILTMLSAGGTVFAIHVLILLVNKTGAGTYEALAARAFGPKAKYLVAATVFSLMWGLASVYVVVIGSLMAPVQVILVENTSYPKGYWGKKIIQALFWLVFMMPLALLKEIDSLKVASTLAVFAIGVVLIAMLLHASLENPRPVSIDNMVPWPAANIQFVLALNNIKVAYSGQTTSFAIYSELKDHTIRKMTVATTVAMVLCGIIYCLSGMFGLAGFGRDVKDNILNSFEKPFDTWYLIAAYACMTFTITMSFPIVMFPTRDAVLQVIGYKDAYVTPASVRMGVSFALSLSALVVGMFVPSLSLMFGIIGGISGNLIAYVYPAVLALKVGFTAAEFGMPRRVGVWILVVVGAILGPIGTGVAIYSEFAPKK